MNDSSLPEVHISSSPLPARRWSSATSTALVTPRMCFSKTWRISRAVTSKNL